MHPILRLKVIACAEGDLAVQFRRSLKTSKERSDSRAAEYISTRIFRTILHGHMHYMTNEPWPSPCGCQQIKHFASTGQARPFANHQARALFPSECLDEK